MKDSKVLNVRGVLIKNNKILLIRHNYEKSKIKFLIPGGYLKSGEKLVDAVKRNIFEETKIQTNVDKLLAIKYTAVNWYAIFSMDYINDEKELFKDEYSKAIFMDVDEALNYPDVTKFTKNAIEMALNYKIKEAKEIDYTLHDITSDDYSLLSVL